jgi:transposase
MPGKPSTRRYTPAETEQAVRLVRQLRKELGTDQGTVGADGPPVHRGR